MTYSLSTLIKHNLSTTAPSFPPSTSKDDEPAIPDPAVFRTSPLTASSLPPNAPPTVSQCAVHLKLLQALSKLNHRVTKESALIEIFGTAQEETDIWWTAFVEIAVERFMEWWKGAETELRRRESKNGSALGDMVRELPDELLPPLDVLMVWHSYMLNPRCYNEDALHFGFELILGTAFPWAQVHAAIDDESFDYTLPEAASKFFEKLTSQSPNLIDDLLWKDTAPKKRIECPPCGKDVNVRICHSEKKGGGWVDDEFTAECSGCGSTITKEILCAEKFKADLKTFLEKGDTGRMRMTNLNADGRTPSEDPAPASWDAANFTNTLFRTTPIPTLPTIPTLTSSTLPPSHLSALTLCLSAYSTPTPFSLDLTAAVIRQGDFVSKMNDQLWIRSPALIGTLPLDSLSSTLTKRAPERGCVLADTSYGFLSRAIDRYGKYFALFKSHPGKILVPTLDVDLVWHSAMLTPVTYRFWCRGVAGRFIDHDDKLGSGVLEGGFEFTGEVFWEAYRELYGKCCCWFCEAAVSEGVALDEREGLWGRLRRRGKKEKGVRVRVEFYREVERKRREKLGGLARVGLFEALKRC